MYMSAVGRLKLQDWTLDNDGPTYMYCIKILVQYFIAHILLITTDLNFPTNSVKISMERMMHYILWQVDPYNPRNFGKL